MSDTQRADVDVTATNFGLSRTRAFLIGMLLVLTAILFQSRVRSYDPRLQGAWRVTHGARPGDDQPADTGLSSRSRDDAVWVFRSDGTGGRSRLNFIRNGMPLGETFFWWTQGSRLYIDQSDRYRGGVVVGMAETFVRRLLESNRPQPPVQRFDFEVEDAKTIRLQMLMDDATTPLYLTWATPPPAQPVRPSARPAARPAPAQESSTISDLYVEERLRDEPFEPSRR